jgi:UDP-xylose/UDP-N-acetylglucosamine transporter B4
MSARNPNAAALRSRSNAANGSERKKVETANPLEKPVAPDAARDAGFTTRQALPALLDLQVALALVLGGCCSNVWTYEELLRINPKIGSALTFSQMIFITLYRLPSFLHHDPDSLSWLPTLRPRQVPLTQWATQVVLFTSGSLIMNWVYAYDVPLSLMIVFRSAGLVISMILGRLLLQKRYSLSQVVTLRACRYGGRNSHVTFSIRSQWEQF